MALRPCSKVGRSGLSGRFPGCSAAGRDRKPRPAHVAISIARARDARSRRTEVHKRYTVQRTTDNGTGGKRPQHRGIECVEGHGAAFCRMTSARALRCDRAEWASA